jgi:hypothetical protein
MGLGSQLPNMQGRERAGLFLALKTGSGWAAASRVARRSRVAMVDGLGIYGLRFSLAQLEATSRPQWSRSTSQPGRFRSKVGARAAAGLRNRLAGNSLRDLIVQSRSWLIARIRTMYSRGVLKPAVLEIDQQQVRQVFDDSSNSEHNSAATTFSSSLKWSITHSVQALYWGGFRAVRWRPRCRVHKRSSVQVQHCATEFFVRTLDQNGRDDAQGGLASDGVSSPGDFGAPRRSTSRGRVVRCKHASGPLASQHLRCALNAGGVYSSSVSLRPRCHWTYFSGRCEFVELRGGEVHA